MKDSGDDGKDTNKDTVIRNGSGWGLQRWLRG